MSGVVRKRGTLSGIVAAALLVACLASTSGRAAGHPSTTRISLSGRIGSLRIDVSTRAEIVRRLGAPDYSQSGNIGEGDPPTPNYQLLGYDCSQEQSSTACAVNYYLNAHRHRLESFSTVSAAFILPGGVHVGMPAAKAARIEREPDIGGCAQGIAVTTSRLHIYISTRGGHLRSGGEVVGGRVSAISIDDRRHGDGVGICL